MTRNMLLPILCLGAVWGTTTVHAQVMECNVPFNFSIGKTAMAPGKYQVSFPSQTTVLLRNVSTNQTAITLTNGGYQPNKRLGDQSRLVFTRYAGDVYFLSQVWTQGRPDGRVLPKTKTEIEVARGPKDLITIASR